MDASQNAFAYSRLQVAKTFCAHIDGPSEATFLVVAARPPSAALRDALGKAALALGWEDGPTFVSCDAPSALSKAEFFELVEGLDPLRLVLADDAACARATEAYGDTILPQTALHLFGRPTCAFFDLDSLLGSEAGKQQAWTLLKTLAR